MTHGIVIINLGSPTTPSVKDVRSYLKEFLMDKYVIDVPYILRWIIVNLFILPFRPKNSAEAYQKVWTKTGSPLVETSKDFLKKLQPLCNYPVELGMRYGEPSINTAINNLVSKTKNLKTVHIIPLYPHYAMSSTKTVVEKTKDVINKNFPQLKLSFQPPFYNEANYINNLADSMSPYLKENYDHLLFSYHGLPERHLKKTDPTQNHCLQDKNCCTIDSNAHKTCYRHQVYKTTELVCNQLSIPKDKYSLSFQSRLGKDPWIQPFTDEVIINLAKNGIKKLAIVCPAFVTDCLETLEEIAMEAKEEFLSHGGKEFRVIPCLNTDPNWIKTVANYSNNSQP